MVGGDGVSQVQQDVRVLDGPRGGRLFGLKVKEGEGAELHGVFLHNHPPERKNTTALTSLSKNEGHLMYVDLESHGNKTESGASREFQRLSPVCGRRRGVRTGLMEMVAG